MGAIGKITLTVIFHVIVLEEIRCTWWDEHADTAKIFYADGPARIRDHPHTVAILNIAGECDTELMCGGFNIGIAKKKYGVVLTSGSCVNRMATGRVRKEDVYISSNSEYWNCGCSRSEVYGVKEWRLHPDYEQHILPFIGAFAENDIGIIILKVAWGGIYNEMALKNPIQFDVPTGGWKDARGTTLGWGYREVASETTEDLQIVENLVVISGESCSRSYYKDYFPKNSYCIGEEHQPEKGPCAFDQGGPVFMQNRGSNKNALDHILLGIASTAPVCGDSRRPTIVLNTSTYIPFIQDLSWVDTIDKVDHKKGRMLSQYLKAPPIGKNWKCKKRSMGGKLCCTPNKKKCVGIKKSGSWWWTRNDDGVEDGSIQRWGSDKQNMWGNIRGRGWGGGGGRGGRNQSGGGSERNG